MGNSRLVMMLLCVLLSGCSLSGCSPTYVIRAAYEESKILLNREDIPDVIADPKTSLDEQAKLVQVTAAREFARNLGLNPEDSFTTYSRVDRDILAWVVVGSKPDAFALHTWWFPIVGSVPYKGFFEREDANEAADELIAQGYETSVRGTEAISTLGWFNDPLLSTTLRHPEMRVVNTVFHEILHSTVWIKGDVQYNESLANFVGHQATRDFYKSILKQCLDSGLSCAEEKKNVALAEEDYQLELEVSLAFEKVYAGLDALYKSGQTTEQILAKREEVFNHEMQGLRKQFPNLKILKTINNAEIIQLKLYLTDLKGFENQFIRAGSWANFISEIKKKAEA